MTYVLRIFDTDKQTVRVQEITTRSVKIGRSKGCDVVLASPYVSREHALLRCENGRYELESVGMNETRVRGEVLAESRAVELRPDDEIRIAEYALFIEAPHEETEQELDVGREMARTQLDLHARLLEQVDMRDSGGSAAGQHRLRQVLDELVTDRVPKLPPAVFDYALRECLYTEIIGEVMRRTAGDDLADRFAGFSGKIDTMLSEAVNGLCDALGVEGKSSRADASKVATGFDDEFAKFRAQVADQLATLFVQRYLNREILNLVCGFGPLQDLLELPNVSEIMVVHKDLIYVERDGQIERLHRTFLTDKILQGIIARIVEPLGRRIDRSTPLVDARLPDGSRVNAIIPPLAIKGPCLTIRKFSKDPLTAEDLVGFGSWTGQCVEFLKACVAFHRNVVISGGTGSGKTTLLNILSGFIGDTERIVTIEDSAELQLRQPHVVTLETRPPNVEGKGAYTIRDLVKNALRMRPDRIVVGECRGGEALDMLQAMNTGHDGSLTTLHANSPEDALLRLETMVLQAVDLPVKAIRDQIDAAVHLIVQARRLPTGKRMVTHVSEVVGIDPVEGVLLTNDIFEERDQELVFSGYLPTFIDEIVGKGHLDPAILFQRETEEVS